SSACRSRCFRPPPSRAAERGRPLDPRRGTVKVGRPASSESAPLSPSKTGKRRVGLFVTCLVDLIRPSVGFAAVKLLEEAGCTVSVPSQTCCGQPAFHSGDRRTTKALAWQRV